MIVFLIWFERYLARFVWFWCILTLFTAYHVLAIFNSPLGYYRYMGMVVAPFIAADFFFMYFVLHGIERLVRGSKFGSLKILWHSTKPN